MINNAVFQDRATAQGLSQYFVIVYWRG